jgi:hypothetical protein
VLVSCVQRRGLAPLEMVRDWGIPIISWSVLTTCRISVASGWKIEFGMGSVCGSASPCRITAPFLLVRCFVPLFCLGPSELGTVCGSASPCRITAPFLLVHCFVPLFCLVAYFDVGPLFRPVVLFGCLFYVGPLFRPVVFWW